MLDNSDQERTLSDTCAPGVEEGANANPNDTRQEQIHTEDGDDIECDEPVHKRPKINPKCFPWVIADKSSGTGLQDKCVETRDLIANYTIDLKLAKAHLLNSGATLEFPNLEWKSVLLGLAVILDVVFSGCYSTEHEAKVTQEVRDFTISTRELSTSKTIKMASDWFIAWNQTAAATVFALPYHYRECNNYSKHILSLFTAFRAEHHHLILNYNKAVRKRVALWRDLLFTDMGEFKDLRVQYLDVRGANLERQAQMGTG